MKGTTENRMRGELDDIKAAVLSIREDWPWSGDRVDEALKQIWGVASELQRRIELPSLTAGRRRDAVDQLARLYELLSEGTIAALDDRQLAGLGWACDLAQEKVEAYLRMASELELLERKEEAA